MYIPRFAQLAAPLFQLTRKSTDWRDNTPLPPQAQSAFEQIRAAIVSKPCMAYPSRTGKYTLQVDAAQGDAKNAGGLGAVLMQTQPDGTRRPIGFASRQLYAYEKKYLPFLLEMGAAVYGMD